MKNPAPRSTSRTQAAYHKIKSIELVGGFLGGVRLDLDDALNCIIGGRGTGKTSVLEAIRFALRRVPEASSDKNRHDAIESLLAHSVGDGSVRLQIETSDGVAYTVTRTRGAAPLVTNADGKRVDIDVGKDTVFAVEIYSQNQIEETATNALYQLELLDKFVAREVADLTRKIKETSEALDSNASRILEARRAIDDLVEATRELPDLAEKLRGVDKGAAGGAGEVLRSAREQKARRARELAAADTLRALYAQSVEDLAESGRKIRREIEDAFDGDLAPSPNRDLVDRLRDRAETTIDEVERHLAFAAKAVRAAAEELPSLRGELADRHAAQETQYRALVDQHEKERAKGAEHDRLTQRRDELNKKAKKLGEGKAALRDLEKQREKLRAKLSDLRDQRYQARLGVAKQLSDELSPMIRVRVEQFGNRDEYRNQLNAAMKGSAMRYAAIVDRAVDRVPPAELAAMIQSEDAAGLQRELDLDADRATRVIIQLKDKPEIFAIETVELHDRPILELKDGDKYKDSRALSTGQKCTTILPILLIESERPLLIDQPEDNLDNAFVYETIVGSIEAVRGRRQLIFVTHNPNIPVLGDAARVFALQSTGRSASLLNVGTVDDVAGEIMTILEGGRDAFEARRDRYGIAVPGKRAR